MTDDDEVLGHERLESDTDGDLGEDESPADRDLTEDDRRQLRLAELRLLRFARRELPEFTDTPGAELRSAMAEQARCLLPAFHDSDEESLVQFVMKFLRARSLNPRQGEYVPTQDDIDDLAAHLRSEYRSLPRQLVDEITGGDLGNGPWIRSVIIDQGIATKFDPAFAVKFATYARYFFKGVLFEANRRYRTRTRREMEPHLGDDESESDALARMAQTAVAAPASPDDSTTAKENWRCVERWDSTRDEIDRRSNPTRMEELVERARALALEAAPNRELMEKVFDQWVAARSSGDQRKNYGAGKVLADLAAAGEPLLRDGTPVARPTVAGWLTIIKRAFNEAIVLIDVGDPDEVEGMSAFVGRRFAQCPNAAWRTTLVHRWCEAVVRENTSVPHQAEVVEKVNRTCPLVDDADPNELYEETVNEMLANRYRNWGVG